MTQINEQIEAAKKVVAEYVKALNSLDIEPITYLIHPHFLFRYSVGFSAGGLRNDWRYLGYLYQTFATMKKEGVDVLAELVLIGETDYTYPCVLLHPPHDRRIIFPNEERLIESVRGRLPEKQVFLKITLRDGKIFRAHCLLHPTEYETSIVRE